MRSLTLAIGLKNSSLSRRSAVMPSSAHEARHAHQRRVADGLGDAVVDPAPQRWIEAKGLPRRHVGHRSTLPRFDALFALLQAASQASAPCRSATSRARRQNGTGSPSRALAILPASQKRPGNMTPSSWLSACASAASISAVAPGASPIARRHCARVQSRTVVFRTAPVAWTSASPRWRRRARPADRSRQAMPSRDSWSRIRSTAGGGRSARSTGPRPAGRARVPHSP